MLGLQPGDTWDTPLPLLLWELGEIDIKLIINQRKLIFFHHLFTLNESSLARAMAEEQERMNFPGLVSECKQLLCEMGLGNIEVKQFSKYSWKKLIKRKIFEMNCQDLIVRIRKHKKKLMFNS